MNDRPGRLSGRTALGLMAALCLLFAGLVLASALRFFPKDQSIQAAAAEPERLLTGADEPGRVALELLPGRVAHYSRIMGLTPTGITVTGAEKRFGSCSGKNRLCFSWRVMLYPPEAIDYVVVHELAHIKHKNHGREFYALVASVLPDYRHRENILQGREDF